MWMLRLTGYSSRRWRRHAVSYEHGHLHGTRGRLSQIIVLYSWDRVSPLALAPLRVSSAIYMLASI